MSEAQRNEDPPDRRVGRWWFPYCWPSGYGPIEGALLVLVFALLLPMIFFGLWVETRSLRAAWRLLWDLD